MHRILYGPLLTLVALSGVIVGLPASAAPTYVAIPLTLGGTKSCGKAVNSKGEVAGTSDIAGDASATLTRTGPGIYSGSLIRTSGPAFSSASFNPDAVTRTVMGTATVTFTHGNAGSFVYQVNNGTKSVMRTVAITRQVFRGPGTVCQ